jgi:pyruvate dehydrogenase E1 component
MNENYHQPPMPEGVEDGILKGMYQFKKAPAKTKKTKVQLMGSGTILREVITASKMLLEDFDIESDIWSVTSFNELKKDASLIARNNRLNVEAKDQKSYVETCFDKVEGPFIAATDYMSIYADQIREFIPGKYIALGTDGFGRSDTRSQLRHFFEVDAKFITFAALKALADEGKIDNSKVLKAMKKYGIDKNKPAPLLS